MYKPSDFGITLRSVKGEPLTHEEMDKNFKASYNMILYTIGDNYGMAEEFIALLNPVGEFSGGSIPATDKNYVAYTVDPAIIGKTFTYEAGDGDIIFYDASFNELSEVTGSGTVTIPEGAAYIVGYALTSGATFTEVSHASGSGSGNG